MHNNTKKWKSLEEEILVFLHTYINKTKKGSASLCKSLKDGKLYVAKKILLGTLS